MRQVSIRGPKVGLQLDEGGPVQVHARGAGAIRHPNEVCPERASFIQGRQVARGRKPQSDDDEDRSAAQGQRNDPPAPPGGLVASSPARVLGCVDHGWGSAITTNRGAVA